MKRMIVCSTLLILMLLASSVETIAQANGIVKGVVKSIDEKDGLPFANVMLVGTSMGCSTDFEGNYIIRNIPIGKYTVKVSFVGYESQTKEIVVQDDKTIEVNFVLAHVTIEGKEIVVQAQAAGQIAAINQQLSSNSIVNVVSAAKIQEIPDANAAESVGRLPGVSIQRVGGEGNKVVIRGLSPKFTAINVNGVRMTATGSGDRSTDISMISPYMLEGIEVMKALTPDKDADVIGGSVDFKLKEAPYTGPKLNTILQGGYNEMINAFEDYKFVLSGSSRFFDDKIGIFAQLDLENRDRSSDELSAGFEIVNPKLGQKNEVNASSATFMDFMRKKQRYGGSLMMDYKFDLGKVSFSNFVSYIKNDVTRRSETFNSSLNTHSYYMGQNKNDLFISSSALNFDYDFGFIKAEGILSGSFSENKSPLNVNVVFEEGAALVSARGIPNPFDIVKTAKNDLKNTYANTMNGNTSYTKELELTAALNFEFNYELSDGINSKTKFGGKIKLKDKYNNNDRKYREFLPYAYSRQTVLDNMPFLKLKNIGSADASRLPLAMFVDSKYSIGKFLNNQFTFGPTIDFSLIEQMYGVLDNAKDIYRPGVTGSMMWTDYQSSLTDDYKGDETYNAAYLMTTIKLGDELTFMPGIRFEYNKTNYTGNRGNNSLEPERGYLHHDTTLAQTNNFVLPMVHLKYDPTNWLSFRLAYTKSLSRPNYGQIIPSYFWNVNGTTLSFNNYLLKPAESGNLDFLVTVFENKIGLLSLGLFYKKIENLVYSTGKIANVDPAYYNVPDNIKVEFIQTEINNDNPAEIKGLELDWQTNFWYLPKPFDGLVLNINYTHITSKTKYPKYELKNEIVGYDTLFGGVIIVPRTKLTNIKSTYEARVVDQPDDIINISLGYDYKGFSARISMLYQDDILSTINFWEELRSSTDTYVRWDFSAKQKLPLEGLQVFLNLNNITSAVDKSLIFGSGYPISEQHYGMTADLGIRYNF